MWHDDEKEKKGKEEIRDHIIHGLGLGREAAGCYKVCKAGLRLTKLGRYHSCRPVDAFPVELCCVVRKICYWHVFLAASASAPNCLAASPFLHGPPTAAGYGRMPLSSSRSYPLDGFRHAESPLAAVRRAATKRFADAGGGHPRSAGSAVPGLKITQQVLLLAHYHTVLLLVKHWV